MPRPRKFGSLSRPKPINIVLPGLGRGVGHAKDRFRISSGTRDRDVYEARVAMVRKLANTDQWPLLRGALDRRYSIAELQAAFDSGSAALKALKAEHTGKLVMPLLRKFAQEYNRADAKKTLARIERYVAYVGARGETLAAQRDRKTRALNATKAARWRARVTVSELTPDSVVGFLSSLQSARHTRSARETSGGTRNRYRAAIGSFATWLVRRDHIEKHPIAFKAVEKYAEAMHRLPDMTPHEYRGYFEHMDEIRPDMVVLFKLLIHTGADIGEVESREVRDFDLSEGAPRVRYRRTKTRTPERWVPVPRALVAAIRGHIAAHDLKGTARVFRMFIRRDAETAHRIAATAIGRPELTIKDLRHIAAIYWRRAGEDLQTVQQRLGHATIQQTVIYTDYAPVSESEARGADKAANLMSAESDIPSITTRRKRAANEK